MNNTIIKLECDKTINVLVGFEAGKSAYESQIKGKTTFDNKITIIVPDNIKRIGSSFIQGFFGQIKETIGIQGIENLIEVKSSETDFTEMIVDNLL